MENTYLRLSQLLATTFSLYLKTHNFHWNIKGSNFYGLHKMLEEQYTELWLAVDVIAERIRAIGFSSPGSYADFARLSKIKDSVGVPKDIEMIKELLDGHHIVINLCNGIIKEIPEENDPATREMLVSRISVHEKMAWFLKSTTE